LPKKRIGQKKIAQLNNCPTKDCPKKDCPKKDHPKKNYQNSRLLLADPATLDPRALLFSSEDATAALHASKTRFPGIMAQIRVLKKRVPSFLHFQFHPPIATFLADRTAAPRVNFFDRVYRITANIFLLCRA